MTADNVQITVTGRNMSVDEPMRQYVVKKMDKLVRYLDRLSRVEVILATRNTRESSRRSMAEAVATARGRTVRAESVDADMRAAVDGLVDKLQQQLTRAK